MKRCRNISLDSSEMTEYDIDISVSDPAVITEQKDMVRHVKNIIETLPSLQQTIIRMKDVEGYELQEIAAITDTLVEAVRVNLSRARKKVREQMIRQKTAWK